MRNQRAWKLVWAILTLLLAGGGAWFGRTVAIAEQWPVFDGLRTTASFVFTVVGIWLALIYPEVLQALSSWRQGYSQQAPRISRLFEPLIESAMVVGVVSLIALVRPLASRLPMQPDQLTIIRAGSFGLLVALTLLQLRALYGAVTPLLGVGDAVASQEARARVRGRFPEPRPSGPSREPAQANHT